VSGQVLGRRLVYRGTTGSTNDDARALAAAGEPEGTVVVADAQTGGRGRVGKSRWLTPPNTSIALSVLLRPPLLPRQLPVLAALCGVAAVEAIREVAGVPVALKWPNDVLAGERKAGGILVESSIAGGRVTSAVLGIGLNVNLPAAALGALPDAAVAPTTLLDEVGRAVEREALLIALLRALDARYALIRRGDLAAVWQAYRALLSTIGQYVRVLTSGGAVDGIAEGVAPDGALRVRLGDGTVRAFPYGDVTVRGAPRSAPRSGA
jgi:BirA family biotin operon repressor/biotin-[acetyl-CoA-carboxylase] ligase